MRVRTVLLVGSAYDAFLLESAGFRRQAADDGASAADDGASAADEAPLFVLAESGDEALRRLPELRPELVIADHSLPDLTGRQLLTRLATEHPGLPAILITSRHDLGGPSVGQTGEASDEPLFIWQGDPAMLRSLVHLHEDEANAPALLGESGALAMLLVEDEPLFYSHYLPLLYEQLREHTVALLPAEQRPTSPWSALANRPLVLLRKTFEGACEVLDRYPQQMIGLISDMQFPVSGRLAPNAGLRLLYRARARAGHLPIMIQSHETEMERVVREGPAHFVSKDSPHLFQQIGIFLSTYCGFGPFVFCLPGGAPWGRAETLVELRNTLAAVPDVLYEYHGLHNDFSSWLSVHGYGEAAAKVRRISISEVEARSRILRALDEEIARQAVAQAGGWTGRGEDGEDGMRGRED